jgi:hypothetical protein
VQLDKTRIVIRERDLPDTLDLTLQVIRRFASGLIIPMLLGIVPFALLNYVLIGWMTPLAIEASREQIAQMRGGPFEDQTYFFAAFTEEGTRYLWAMFLLVFWQGPTATAIATAWLGGAVFQRDQSWIETLREVGKLFPRLLWTQFILRGVIVGTALPLLFSEEFSPGWEIVLPIFLLIYVGLLRMLRPYMNEIVLLERNPLFAKAENTMTIGRRSNFLHSPSSSDLILRAIVAAAVGVSLCLAIVGSLYTLGWYLFNDRWWISRIGFDIVIPFSMWCVVAFMAVFRFLSYLDLRIRYEGWEVELLMRAEAERLAKQFR